MLIDWFTVGAQTLNFLILVWLMQRYLYRPILRAIDAREARIAKELADADLKKADAQKERDEFQRKNEELDRRRVGLVEQMTSEVESERARLLDEARKAVDAVSAQRMEALRMDARNLSQAIGQRAQQEVFAIIRKVLADLAGTTLEERMADVFVRQLRALSEPEKEALKTAFQEPSGSAVVHSAFDLPMAQRVTLESAIRDLIGEARPLRFETVPTLLSGLELIANGRKIAWNISAYLLSMEKGLSELLEVKGHPDITAESEPGKSGPGTVNA